MWINERTGKGWTDQEETQFAQLMEAGNLERIKAIQLWKRFGKEMTKAMKHATEHAKISMANREATAKRFKRATARPESVGGERSARKAKV